MAVDLHDSQFVLILAPALLIALMFLFFWLFVREASYDEALERHKRRLGLPPARPGGRRKAVRKKSKKKEGGVTGGGDRPGGEGDSDSEPRDFDLTDAVASSEEELPAVPEAPAPAPNPLPATANHTAAPEAPAAVVAPSTLRERRKRKEKQQQLPTAAATTTHHPEEPSPAHVVNGSKPTSRKSQSPAPITKQPTSTPPAEPANKKKGSHKKHRIEADGLQLDTRVDQDTTPVKKEASLIMEPKAQEGLPTALAAHTPTSGGGRRKSSSKKQKNGPALVDKPPIQASVCIPLMDSDPPAPSHPHSHPAAPAKINNEKQKNEGDKEGPGAKLTELLAGLRRVTLSEEEVGSVAAVLKEKNPPALEAWCRTTVESQLWVQQLRQRECRLVTLQEEASIAKDKVKQLSQELQTEKQKMGRVDSLLHEQRVAMEKELSAMQAKSQASYQMKFQQLREQASQFQKENGILRDAVSRASNQRESEQSAELSELRSEYTALLQQLGENSSKLQQEELQRNTLEAQLQDAKRRWEDVQSFLHNINAEREKLQAAKQELQNQLLSVESEMNDKKREIQSLHSTLTDTLVSKEQLEHKVLELLESTEHGRAEETGQVEVLLTENKSLQVQMERQQAQIASQATHLTHFEELQRLLAEKEMQRKGLEHALNAERSSGAGRESDMQAMHTEYLALKAELHNLRAQIADQAAAQLVLDQFQTSVQEKDDKIRMVEEMLEASLLNMADKEEELKVQDEEVKRLREESVSLKQEVEVLQNTEQAPSPSTVEELQRTVQEKEDRLQTELEIGLGQEKTIEALEQQVEALRADVERARLQEAEESTTFCSQLQELQTLLAAREEEVQALQRAMEEGVREVANREQQLQALQQEGTLLRGQLEHQQQGRSEAPSEELSTALAERDGRVSELQREAAELRESLEMHRKKNNELREKNWSAMEALSATESLLQGKLSKNAKESQKALESVQLECHEILHRLLPAVPLPCSQNHEEWLQKFECAAKEAMVVEPVPPTGPGSEGSKMWEEKLKESEEAQMVLKKDCETYKKVMGETEGMLRRLKSSVEQEETHWRVKLEVSQGELRGLRLDNEHLTSELERMMCDSATYVAEATKLKAQLTEALCRLEAGQSQRQKVAGDLCKAQKSLDLIQEEMQNESLPENLIDNNSATTQREALDCRREKMAAKLYQTAAELQQLLHALNRQLTEGQEVEGNSHPPEV
ncbi:hypothetical protein AAFF_G00241110 [Aldrovandia affinis]|uniref:Ribosome receptor lysine/proline rich domain-containing protein n=1 Tax=Aldrovandia affinis TaxID=143900 RepID=A0AAD7SUV0_9TELE|nr:hypothetical protein AAFF_G00241110 [Aldrovandia affinis]